MINLSLLSLPSHPGSQPGPPQPRSQPPPPQPPTQDTVNGRKKIMKPVIIAPRPRPAPGPHTWEKRW
jgi:hypothetical protein